MLGVLEFRRSVGFVGFGDFGIVGFGCFGIVGFG
jgi:hypothetical protein